MHCPFTHLIAWNYIYVTTQNQTYWFSITVLIVCSHTSAYYLLTSRRNISNCDYKIIFLIKIKSLLLLAQTILTHRYLFSTVFPLFTFHLSLFNLFPLLLLIVNWLPTYIVSHLAMFKKLKHIIVTCVFFLFFFIGSSVLIAPTSSSIGYKETLHKNILT